MDTLLLGRITVARTCVVVLIAIVTSLMTFLSLYIWHWWRPTWDACIYFTVVSQSEARVSTEHGINYYIKHNKWQSPCGNIEGNKRFISSCAWFVSAPAMAVTYIAIIATDGTCDSVGNTLHIWKLRDRTCYLNHIFFLCCFSYGLMYVDPFHAL